MYVGERRVNWDEGEQGHANILEMGSYVLPVVLSCFSFLYQATLEAISCPFPVHRNAVRGECQKTRFFKCFSSHVCCSCVVIFSFNRFQLLPRIIFVFLLVFVETSVNWRTAENSSGSQCALQQNWDTRPNSSAGVPIVLQVSQFSCRQIRSQDFAQGRVHLSFSGGPLGAAHNVLLYSLCAVS